MRSLSRSLIALFFSALVWSQQPSTDPGTVVPTLVNLNGMARDTSGKPLAGHVGITFMLYKESEGGAPLWTETQNVQADKSGHYSVMLGSTASKGLPPELFATGEARWLGAQVEGQEEQPRVLLLSVPYALKAADAETLGGLPASAFALAPKGTSSKAPGAPSTATLSPASPSVPPPASSNVTTTGGSAQHLPMFTSPTNIQNSIASQIGTTAISVLGKLGVNTSAPAQNLDISSGDAIVRGVGNFRVAGNKAFLYVGDTSHPIEAIWDTGLAIGAYLVPQALFIQDRTGNVGIGTTTPDAGLDVKSVSGLAGDFRSVKTGSTAVSVTGGPGSARLAGGTGFTAAGGPNKADGGTGGVGGSFVGGSATGINNIGQGGTGASFQGGTGPQGFGFTGGVGLISVGGEGSDLGVGGDGAHVTGAFGLGGGTGIVATGGGGDPSGCGGMFFGGFGVAQGGGFACVGGGNDARVDIGADGIDASSVASDIRATYAGNFTGDLNVTGTIFAGTKDFRIDHPLDPANKYLSHASVESSEMKNIYDGSVTTDVHGDAVVELPNWFEVVNGDFRYQLTVIGQFAQAIVSRKIANHQFSIKTDKPGVEVCWQVTGIRRDAFAKVHPLMVEEMKPANLRGFYVHPELYGQPEARQIEWARHPAMMKRFAEIHKQATQAKTTRARFAEREEH